MDFNILHCEKLIAPCKSETPKRIVRNYEFDFYIQADRKIFINENEIKLNDGCICVKKPGQFVYSIGDFNCYMLTVDFSRQTATEDYIRNTALITEPLSNNFLINKIPDVLEPRHSNDLKFLFSSLTKQADKNSDIAHLLFEEILFLINADLTHDKLQQTKPNQTAVDEIYNYISRNFFTHITLDTLASLVNFEKSYLIRVFKEQFSITPIDYLIQCRLNHAANLLLHTNLSVTEIALQCGYNTPGFFLTQFKKCFGITPLQYRKKITE